MKNRPLALLPILEAIAAEGSVSAAARRLSLSQPAVSHALNRLRRQVGDPLFVRSGRGLVPTPRAEAMIAPTRQLLREAEALLARAQFSPATDSREFRIATSDFSALAIVPGLLRHTATAAPRISFSFLAFGPDSLRQLEQGLLDLSLWGTAPPDGFHYQRLFTENYACVLREGHPVLERAAAGAISLEDYAACSHMAVSLRDPGAREVDKALAALGQSRRIAITSHSFAGILEALRGTDLIATLPRRLCATGWLKGLAVRALPFALPDFDYGMVWHSRTDADPALAWLRARLAEAAAAG